MQDLIKEIETTFSAFGLDEFISSIQESNPSRALPYHNNHHMYVMAYLALEILNRESADHGIEVTNSDRLDVVVAGLLHDYGHNGTGPDIFNIQSAVEYVYQLHYAGKLPEGCCVSEVTDIIRITEFPFVYAPTNIKQRAIRDADLLYVLFSDIDTQGAVQGLFTEVFGDPAITKERIQKQKDFYAGVTWYTTVGKMCFDKQFPDYIRFLESQCVDL